jgi:hypothetical protein
MGSSVGLASFVFRFINAARLRLAYNEQGLALLGYLKNVSPQLKPNIVLKVEDNN